MKYLFTIFLFVSSLFAIAQDGADRITFSKFDKPRDVALIDSAKGLLLAGSYSSFISNEKEVYNKTSATNKKFLEVKKLLDKLSSNGSDDVSQCFYPQHSINFYKAGKLVKYVLICFDCYGLRFSDERWITRIRNEKKRIDLMGEMKAYFTSEGL